MLFRLKEIIKEKGLWGGIKYIFSKLTGREALKESIDTAFYLLNRYMDIGQFPKAEGSLRQLQLCDAELLHIFDLVCKKNGLTYWLDWGTLLGAKRHKGFIPWDDDMDVSMPRKDFERAREILPEEIKKYGLEVRDFEDQPFSGFGFTYRHEECGVWLDIFPTDSSEKEIADGADRRTVSEAIKKYRKYYLRNKGRMTKEDIFKMKEMLLGPSGNGFLYNSPEFEPKAYIHQISEVYPLSSSEFEGYMFSVPGDVDGYLRGQYGDTYMEFPRSGVEHHGDAESKISEWHKKYGISMDDILGELKDIAERYQQDSLL